MKQRSIQQQVKETQDKHDSVINLIIQKYSLKTMNASASVTKASVTNPDNNKQTPQQLVPRILKRDNFRDVDNFHMKILVGGEW